jgi:hypothetical protein
MANQKDNAQGGLYKRYENANTYRREEGILILPLASSPPTSPTAPAPPLPVVIRIHQPYTVRNNYFNAKKEQTPPVVPGASTTDTLISTTVSVPLPKPNLTGNPTYIYEIEGSYTYLSSVPYGSTTGFPAGEYPFEFPQLQEREIAADTLYGIGALIGGAAYTGLPMLAANIPIETGLYFWPYTHMPKAFFNTELTKTN